MPQGTALEETDRALMAAAERLKDLPELTSIQAYAGTAAPFNFNGLVRHYYLRDEPQQGDLAVNLVDKAERKRASHAIALDIRHRLADLPLPPGRRSRWSRCRPARRCFRPCSPRSTAPTPRAGARWRAKVRKAFEAVDFVVDVDDSFPKPAERLRISIDQQALEFHGVDEQAVYDTIAGAARRRADRLFATRRRPQADRHLRRPAALRRARPTSASCRRRCRPAARLRQGANVELGDVVKLDARARLLSDLPPQRPLRRDGDRRRRRPLRGADLRHAGDSRTRWPSSTGARTGRRRSAITASRENDAAPTLLWDGEWEVTYVTFRDMGAAFIVAMLGIYLLVVAQFGSFKLPLVILTPVPLTLIGIMLGHWWLGAAFTATSMIGFIALAGIIVRNSILLVDFIRRRQAEGAGLRAALIDAGAARVKPIVLTAAAAMIGSAFILADPIFQGLAISLVFGLASSTALTLLVIPAIYVWLRDDERPPRP